MEQSLRIFKESYKFSSAHFLILDEKNAEKLHGHNYQVGLELFFDEAETPKNQGFFCHFGDLKSELKALLDEWDERVLLPAKNSEMHFEQTGLSLSVRFRNRHYMFPADEVVRLPVNNTSVENLSKLLTEKMAERLAGLPFRSLVISVDEAPGQGATSRVSGHQ